MVPKNMFTNSHLMEGIFISTLEIAYPSVFAIDLICVRNLNIRSISFNMKPSGRRHLRNITRILPTRYLQYVLFATNATIYTFNFCSPCSIFFLKL